jgi:glycosyltransferase involved in cell wall biosynthesis
MTKQNGGEAHTVRVAAFTGSRTISSRRFRVLQYVPEVSRYGIRMDEFVARFGSWPPRNRVARPAWLAATVIDRLVPVIRSHWYDVTLLQRELVSTLLTLEPLTGRPRILDVDDAVWLTSARAERNFAALVRACDGVMCGNAFIREVIGQWSTDTLLLPTAVDSRRFRPRGFVRSGPKIVGWSGLYAGSKYLLSIEEALVGVLKGREDVVLRVVSDRRPEFRRIGASEYDFIRWSPDNEVRTIQEMSVGLMPIDDTPWSRGKCSYKMLLYMSCGVPVVVSPYGMNAEVLAQGSVGLGAKSCEDWVSAIRWMLENEDAAERMGENGRSVVEARYALTTLAEMMAGYLKKFVVVQER